jgi:hypothetical protein
VSVTRIAFSSAIRAAAVTLLKDYAADADIKLQVYPARPASVFPPCAFVDRMSESIEYPSSVNWRQRTPRVEVLVLHGIFDSGDAVAQRDRFVDGFLDWVTDNVHAADPNTTIGLVSVEDDPGYVNDWMKPEHQRTYYATRLTLEGFAGG